MLYCAPQNKSTRFFSFHKYAQNYYTIAIKESFLRYPTQFVLVIETLTKYTHTHTIHINDNVFLPNIKHYNNGLSHTIHSSSFIILHKINHAIHSTTHILLGLSYYDI